MCFHPFLLKKVRVAFASVNLSSSDEMWFLVSEATGLPPVPSPEMAGLSFLSPPGRKRLLNVWVSRARGRWRGQEVMAVGVGKGRGRRV